MNLEIRPYSAEDEQAVITLWEQCRLVVPANQPQKDIARKSKVQPELFLVAVLDGMVVGSCMAGYEGHRGWINYLAVAPAQQRQGIATQLLAAAEKKLRALGCPKINLQVRETNAAVIEFYERLGFERDPVISLGKRLTNDSDLQP